jgi:NAD(P)-dependent dehydrogenase (short-subunit alcohol dehydrogenase family)
MFDFTEKTAFVTGAGAGIGRAVALLLGAARATVACVDQDPVGADATADQIRKAGGKAIATVLDVSDPVRVNAAIIEVERGLGALDYLVNCAGIIDVRPTETIDDATWARMLAVHLSGTFYTCRAALPGMMARRSGAIVNTGSIFGVRGQANAAHYAAVKAGIVAFTKSLAREKGPYGIRVNAVAPGPTMTGFFARGVGKSGAALDEAATERAKVIALGRIARAEQVAPSYLYLLSPAASHITGECIMVDGGEVMA